MCVRGVASFLVAVAMPLCATAQQSPAPDAGATPSMEERMQRLEQRQQELERELKQKDAEIEQLKS